MSVTVLEGTTVPDGTVAPWLSAPVGSTYHARVGGEYHEWRRIDDQAADADWQNVRIGGATNAKAYGVVGDGVADDTAALVALIAAASNGDTIILEAGTYLISAPLEMTSAKVVNFVGVSPTETIIIADSTFSGVAMILQTYSASGQAVYGQIRNMTLNADRYADRAIWIQKGKAFKVDNVRIFRHLVAGIDLAGNGGSGAVSYDHRFTNVDIDGDVTIETASLPDYGIRLNSGATDNKFDRVSISYAKTAGIIGAASNNLYEQVHVWGGVDYGMQFTTGRQSIINCYFDTCRVAGLGLSANYITIIGCVFYHNSSNGLGVSAADGIKLLSNRTGLAIIGNRFDTIDIDLNLNAKTLGDCLAVGNFGVSIATTDLLTAKILLNGAGLTGGAQTATGTWTATEQDMLQKAYDALRSLGVLA